MVCLGTCATPNSADDGTQGIFVHFDEDIARPETPASAFS